jgi:hypothetical protein
MAGAMKSCERVLATLKRQPVDYVPCCPAFNPLQPEQRRGYTWNFPWSPDASLAEQLAWQVERLGLDALVNVGVTATQPAPDVTQRVWRQGHVLNRPGCSGGSVV